MPMIQIAKIQDSLLSIFLNMTRIVYVLAEFTLHILNMDSNLSYLIWSKNRANL